MADINPYLNKIFYNVAVEKSFTKASEKMGQKKSTISRNIDLLEEQLNVTLFYRDNKGVSLTADGQKYFEFVEKGLGYFEAGEKLVKANNDIETGEITIGALSHISHFYLIEKVQKIREDYPNLRIKIRTGATGKDLINLLESHKIDFALDSTIMPIKNKDIQKEEIKSIENIFISKVPLKIDNLKELESMKLVLGLENTTTSQELIGLMKENNVTIRPDIEIDITELKIDATKMGLGLGYVMKDSVKTELKNKEIYEVEIPIKLPKSTVNLLYLKGQLTNIDKKFIKDYLKK